MNAYKVKVKTTNALHDTWQPSGGGYCKCINKEFYFIDKSPSRIIQIVGESLISIEVIGLGYRDDEFTK